jgi:hypothetical protein
LHSIIILIFHSFYYEIVLLVLTYDDIPGEEDGEGSIYGTPPPSYHKKLLGQTNLPNIEMVRPAQTEQEVAKEEESKLKQVKKPELSEEEKRHIIMTEDFRKFVDRAIRITERALYYNEPPDIFIDYTGAREELDK